MEILSNIRNSVDYIMMKINFCNEAKSEFLSVFDKLALESPQDLEKLLTDYDAGVLNDFNEILNGKTLKKGTKYINVHIPRTNTKLSRSLVEESYKLAADFFISEFQDQPIYFGCHSWLLYPWNIKVLKPESNMAAFYNDFTIVESGDNEDYREIWRLFDCEYNGNPDDLPCDTSLRISYANRIKNGEAWGWGMGIFEYKKKFQ